MTTVEELMERVDAVFGRTASGLRSWTAPHPDRAPLEEEYSRESDPAKWRIVGARADAWVAALVELELAMVEDGSTPRWEDDPPTTISRYQQVTPRRLGALPLVVAWNRISTEDDGVTLGVGDPATYLAWMVPDCGCDACDEGSQGELDRVDDLISSVATGGFRQLSRGDKCIVLLGDDLWTAWGFGYDDQVGDVLADPTGWDELTGPSWLEVERR